MPEISKDVVALLQYLAPGFVVAWVFYGLTSHVKPSQFERVVQALIFTVVVHAVVLAERAVAEAVGERFALGEWSANSQLLASLVTALIVGVAMSACVNGDAFHRWTRKLGIPTGTYLPQEDRPVAGDLIGLNRILATIPSLVSHKFEGALYPVELANGIASMSSYPSAAILQRFMERV